MGSKMLTARGAQTAPVGWHCDGRGLYLQCTAGVDGSIGRSWVYRYNVNGRDRYMGLGPLADVTLAEAREKAAAARKLRLEGIDPLEARRAQRAATRLEAAKQTTFGQCVETFLEFKRPEWSNPKHAEQWAMTLRKYAKPLHAFSPDKIDLALVVETLRPIWHTVTETASRTRQRIEAVLDHWAALNQVHGYVNPARWDQVKHALPSPAKIKKEAHWPALPYPRIPEFICDLRTCEGIAARALEFLTLTSTRTGDIIGQEREDKPPMLWRHVSLTERVWTIPSTKTEAELRVPLSEPALAILQEMAQKHGQHLNSIVFPGEAHDKAMSNVTMAAVIKRMNKDREIPERYTDPKQGNRDIVPHGFRSSFRDWAAEQTNYPNHVVEMALAHTVGDRVEAAYRRGDLFMKRTKLMISWAEYCGRPAPIGATVAKLRRA
jgi:integrase